jgi:hypothetical protein
MAAIVYVFTISRVAEMLGENEGWLHELSIDMFPEHGCLWILGAGDQETTAFTEYGVERLRETIDEERRHGRAPASGGATKSS